MNLGDIRNEYEYKTLSKNAVSKNPYEEFKYWILEALEGNVKEPTAMTLATADRNNRPSARIVLLKNIEPNGFVFFTDFGSRKAHDFEENSQAALLFFWPELFQQIRIEGLIEKIPENEAETYFNSRPLASKISAIISPQSQIIPNRNYLMQKFDFLKRKPESEITKPLNWGGFKLIPDYFEFWQGRKERLHDRICYRHKNDEWYIQRLAP